ncbi:MAG: hypothetical protein KDD04_01845, partial [Sinomicrobium sp.]|nr:hypothetical protein [Sinomicrobium sp.]
MKKIVFIFAPLLLLIGCSKEEAVVPDELQQNRAPGAFALISPVAEAQTDILDITFEWEAAQDPDDDTVTYDLYLYRDGSSPERVAENLTGTSYVMESRYP